MAIPSVAWDHGTAYELFVSLHVLHEPEYYGVRASWAAGIRSRIPATERKFLEEVLPFIGMPLTWITELPDPKDAVSALWGLRQIPAANRLRTLLNLDCWDNEYSNTLKTIIDNKRWTDEQLTVLLQKHGNGKEKMKYDRAAMETFLNWCARPDECGEALFTAVQAYYKAFFDDEEKRIAPVLEIGVEQARQATTGMDIHSMIRELSQGVAFDANELGFREFVFVPAFWTTPLVLLEKIDDNRALFLFGVRPASMAAIPGEKVPEGLVRQLKALADPTRLKILHDISHEELTPSELARRLNLRAPTVTHHLSEMRLAGLVNVTIKGQEKFFRARTEGLGNTFNTLNEFLNAE